MNVDFMHNQIIRDTVTERFMESFNENLLPTLIAEYGASLTDVQFYEDHLASGLRIGGEFFYPLTVVVDGAPEVRTVKWQVSNYRNYDKFNPFSYKGRELLDFELLDFNPDFVLAAIAGRNIYLPPESAMPTSVTSASEDKTFLAGKYSATFIDAMASAVTRLIEEELSISGLATSGVMLEVRFAPGTFMEHVMDGATYRRILIKARGCAARDLWIKWSSIGAESTYTTADHVRGENIIFELVDNVPAKIKEKEYRYLTAEGAEKYQVAMSRKNIVEWRDMMRRVIRRGEVELIEREPIPAPVVEKETVEPIAEPLAEPETEAEPISAANLSYDELLALIDKDEPEEEAPSEDEDDEDDDLTALLRSAIGLTTTPAPTVKAEPMSFDEPEEEAEEYTEPEDEDVSELDALEPTLEEEDEDALPWAEDPTEDEEVVEQIAEEPEESDTDRIRREIEMKIRAEMEAELRRKEEEAERLRTELEERMRAEAREKELLAEAARAALLDRERAEREAEERIAREEAARREEEERRLEEERLERERLEREAEEQRRLEEEERARLEAEANAKREPVYVSKTVKLLFKYQIDPSITKRIHEIIVATIKYYNKEDVYIKIKANIPDPTTLNLEFVKIPEDEVPLIVNIIKVLGRSELGITRAILD